MGKHDVTLYASIPKFEAKFHTDDTAESSHTTVTIKDLRNGSRGPKSWIERMASLKCGSLLD
jgi:hypothetical protein